jgi:hypothetical protein
MQVGMKEEILSPTVEHGKEADLGTEMFGIGSDGGQGLGRGSEQDAVDDIFVLVSHGGDRFGEGEDDMKIRSRENFRLPLPLQQTANRLPPTAPWLAAASTDSPARSRTRRGFVYPRSTKLRIQQS